MSSPTSLIIVWATKHIHAIDARQIHSGDTL
jgi:hypothetical protein